MTEQNETAKERFSKLAAEAVDWWLIGAKAKDAGATDIASVCESNRKYCETQAELARTEINQQES